MRARADFWRAIDTSERFYRYCSCGTESTQHDYRCAIRTDYERERGRSCLAQNGNGDRCNNIGPADFPFCAQYHEKAATLAFRDFMVTSSTINANYGDCSDEVRAVLHFINVGQVYLDDGDKREIAAHLGITLMRALPEPPTERRPVAKHRPVRRCSLYRHYDADGTLLYVGISVDPEARKRQHEATSPWWVFVESSDTDWFLTEVDAAAAERRAIVDESPIFNKAGAPGERDSRAIQYLIQHEAYELLRAAA